MDMIEISDLEEAWEESTEVKDVRKGDILIFRMSDQSSYSFEVVSEPFVNSVEGIRLHKRVGPQVPEGVRAIMAERIDDPKFGRRVFTRCDDGDTVWYDSEEDSATVQDLKDIRVMAEVGDFL